MWRSFHESAYVYVFPILVGIASLSCVDAPWARGKTPRDMKTDGVVLSAGVRYYTFRDFIVACRCACHHALSLVDVRPIHARV